MSNTIISPPFYTSVAKITEALTIGNPNYTIQIIVPETLKVGEEGNFIIKVWDNSTPPNEVTLEQGNSYFWEFGDSYLLNIPPSPNEKYLFPETRNENLCEDTIYLYQQDFEPHHGKGGEIISYIWDEEGNKIPYLYPSGAIRGNEYRAYNTLPNTNILIVGTTGTTNVTQNMYVILENIWKITNITQNKLTGLSRIFSHYNLIPNNVPTKYYIYNSLKYQTYPVSSTGQRILQHQGYGIYNNNCFIDLSNTIFSNDIINMYLVIPVAYKIQSVGANTITLNNNITLPLINSSSPVWYNVISGKYALEGTGTLNGDIFTINSLNPYYFSYSGSGILRGLPICLSNETTTYYSLISNNSNNTITLFPNNIIGTNFDFKIMLQQQPFILLKNVELYDSQIVIYSLYPFEHYLSLYNEFYLAFDNKEIIQVLNIENKNENNYTLNVVRQALFPDIYPVQTHLAGSFLYDIAFRGTRNTTGITEDAIAIGNKNMMFNRTYKQNYVFSGYELYDTYHT